jgi:hypothetical protein
MQLMSYVEELRQQLMTAAQAGGDEARELAERLTAPLESAVQLVLLDALSAAAGEITLDLAPGSVEVRVRGREPEFVVTPPAPEQAAAGGEAPQGPPTARVPAPEGDEGPTSRITFRLPEALKLQVEQAAARDGLSVNAWLVRAAYAAVGTQQPVAPRRGPASGGTSFTGWVQ